VPARTTIPEVDSGDPKMVQFAEKRPATVHFWFFGVNGRTLSPESTSAYQR
jgi:hypothetical protein